jgi:hypothetical protein
MNGQSHALRDSVVICTVCGGDCLPPCQTGREPGARAPWSPVQKGALQKATKMRLLVTKGTRVNYSLLELLPPGFYQAELAHPDDSHFCRS